MVSEPASGKTEELNSAAYTTASRTARWWSSTARRAGVGEFLVARWIWLDDGTELCQLRAPGSDRSAGYERLDNEILADGGCMR